MDHNGEVGHKIYEGMKIVKEMFKKNPTVTGIVVVAGTAALVFAGVKVFKSIKSAKAEKDARNNLEELKKQALEELKVQNLTKAQAQAAADSLYEAMDGVGTDLMAIKKILIDDKPTTLDIIEIVNAFGVRDYGTFGSPIWGDGDKLNLMQWIKEEVNSTTTLYELLRMKFTTAGLPF